MLRLIQRVLPLSFVVACIPHAAFAADVSPEIMMAKCRARASEALRMRLPDIDTKYEGQRVDGTHAVNGTASAAGRMRTFQCNFKKSGRKLYKFIVNKAAAANTPQRHAAADTTVAGTNFHATGDVPCARSAQPMGKCKFGVVRKDKANGNGSITVFWPAGGNRVIYYEDQTPVRYDESQADGGAKMTVGLEGDTYIVKIGDQRFEIPMAVISGG